jgi:hypothetical protein
MGAFTLTEDDLTKIKDQLLTIEKIRYDSDLFYNELTAIVDEHMVNYRIVVLAVAYGYHRMSVSVFCQEEESISHYLPSQESRQESIIFFTGHRKGDMVVKCYPFDKHQ